MAASYKKTNIKTFPRIGEKITRDTLYWKNLEFPMTQKEHGPVTSIQFSPVEPYNFAVTSTIKVQVIGNQSNETLKTFSRFKENARSGSFRHDGKLLVAGGDEGVVRLFDVAGKALLRIFRGHARAVHATGFTSDGLHVISGSDDKTVRLWDIAMEQESTVLSEHQDYVRCAACSPVSSHLVLTGSYDHKVKLFDTRTSSSALTVDHGHPVESVLVYPSGGLILSAGGSVVKVWDALAGGRLVTSFSHHHKTVTCMALASNNQRLLTGGLDRLVQIYDVSTYEVVHTLDYPSPILSMGIAADDSVLAVGMSDGLLSIKHRKADPDAEKTRTERKQKQAYQYRLKARHYNPQQTDSVIEHKRREHLARYDRMLKRFEFTKALDAAMDLRIRIKNPEVVVSVFQELIRRGGLKPALAGRDVKSLANILKFLQKNMSNPKYTSTLVDVANILSDLYIGQVGQSPALDELLLRLKDTINKEVEYMRQLVEMMGTMDMIFAAGSQGSDIGAVTSQQSGVLSAAAIQPSQAAKAESIAAV